MSLTLADRLRLAPALARLAAALMLALAVALAPVALAPAAFAQAPAQVIAPRAQLDSLRAEIAQVETVMARQGITDAELQRQRQRLQPLQDQLRTLIDEQAPRVEQAKVRLEQLGPRPEAKAPAETAEVVQERETREKQFAEADETLKIARAALVQAQQAQVKIGDLRRDLFAKELFTAGPSLLAPEVWTMAAYGLPSDIAASQQVFGDWSSIVARALFTERGLLVGLALLGAIGLYLARARYMPRLKARLAAQQSGSGALVPYIAAIRLIALAAPPALASWLLYAALKAAGLLPPRIQPVVLAVVFGLAIFAFVRGLAEALFAPGEPQRRLVSVQEHTARAVLRTASALAAVLAVGSVLEAWLQAIAAGLMLSIAVRGVVALTFAAALIVGLYQLRDHAEIEQEACLGPYVPVDGKSLGSGRFIGWAVGLAVIVSVSLGYVVFATFLTEQVLWLGILAGMFLLLSPLIEYGISGLLTGEGRFALMLRAGVGLRAATLDKIAVVLTGFLKIVLIVAVIMLAFAPWGLESDDFFASLRAAFFGFQVGGVTISLSSIVVGVLVFVLGLTATRSLQGWLETKFLPTTALDVGLRNSITTAAGYVGYIAAVALAVSSLGLSLERLTLVASALSVGIGFGLQSVVSNFVSGLILLWERPIRVGDQVVVGDAEGIVRRINVRSTEIETFDRSTVVVPNSNLITGVVRNRVRSDRTGRVLISITVPRSYDPQAVRTLLAEAGEAHGDVLKKPPPSVMFKKLGTTTMDFDLVCVVGEVDIVGRVNSDLNFVIHKKLAAMEPAASVPQLAVRGLEGIEGSLENIATAVAGVRRRRRPAGPDEQAPPPAAPPAEDEDTPSEPAPAETPAPAAAKPDDKE